MLVGTTSPYPTVVTVTIAHHSESRNEPIPGSTAHSRTAATTARLSATNATIRTARMIVSFSIRR